MSLSLRVTCVRNARAHNASARTHTRERWSTPSLGVYQLKWTKGCGRFDPSATRPTSNLDYLEPCVFLRVWLSRHARWMSRCQSEVENTLCGAARMSARKEHPTRVGQSQRARNIDNMGFMLWSWLCHGLGLRGVCGLGMKLNVCADSAPGFWGVCVLWHRAWRADSRIAQPRLTCYFPNPGERDGGRKPCPQSSRAFAH